MQRDVSQRPTWRDFCSPAAGAPSHERAAQRTGEFGTWLALGAQARTSRGSSSRISPTEAIARPSAPR